jgi:hypothetical protein
LTKNDLNFNPFILTDGYFDSFAYAFY